MFKSIRSKVVLSLILIVLITVSFRYLLINFLLDNQFYRFVGIYFFISFFSFAGFMGLIAIIRRDFFSYMGTPFVLKYKGTRAVLWGIILLFSLYLAAISTIIFIEELVKLQYNFIYFLILGLVYPASFLLAIYAQNKLKEIYRKRH